MNATVVLNNELYLGSTNLYKLSSSSLVKVQSQIAPSTYISSLVVLDDAIYAGTTPGGILYKCVF
jgi:hypothetical protein